MKLAWKLKQACLPFAELESIVGYHKLLLHKLERIEPLLDIMARFVRSCEKV